MATVRPVWPTALPTCQPRRGPRRGRAALMGLAPESSAQGPALLSLPSPLTVGMPAESIAA